MGKAKGYKISIIGTGYVGLVTGVCLADLGNEVICLDIDKQKIKNLNKCIMPIYEPGLEELAKKNYKKGNLKFSSNLGHGIKESDIIFIAVGTPQNIDHEADLSYVKSAADGIGKNINGYKIVVIKSTVPVGTGEWVRNIITEMQPKPVKFTVVSNPEFLREGTAVYDFFYADRVVIGTDDNNAEKVLKDLYKPLKVPIITCDIRSSEICKYGSNAFLAVKVSFINELANICESVGADITKVSEAMMKDKRIGGSYLQAGIGYGGSCLPKDTNALSQIALKSGYNFTLLNAAISINILQRHIFLQKIVDRLGNLNHRTIGILGLSFKPDTDDVREAPSVAIINNLLRIGADIKAYDPIAVKNMKKLFPGINYCSNPYQTADKSEALIILTEWDEFKNMDLMKIKKLLKNPIIFDGRNIFSPKHLKSLGFEYISMGR